MTSLKRGITATKSESENKRTCIEKVCCQSLSLSSSEKPHRDVSSVMEELEMAEKQLQLGYEQEENIANLTLDRDSISPPVSFLRFKDDAVRETMQTNMISQEKMYLYVNLALIQLNEAPIPFSNAGKITSKSKVDFIPGLVNRIILESTGEQKLYMRTHSMTQVLLSLILKFAKPFLDTQALQSKISQSNSKLILKVNNCKDVIKDKNYTEPNAYKKRAVIWAVDSIQDLLNPNIETRIPALDALLAATGEYDSLLHETVLQDLIILYQDDGNLTHTYSQDTKNLCMRKHDASIEQPELWLSPHRWLNEHENQNSKLYRNNHMLSDCRFLGQVKSFLKRHDNDVSLEDMIKNKNI